MKQKAENTERHTVAYKDKEIEFSLVRKRVKNINLRTKADMSVIVSANNRIPLEYILDFVQKKADWILKNQERYIKAGRQEVREREYISGDVFFYLGKQLCLRVIEAREESVAIYRGFLEVRAKDVNNMTRKRNLVGKFYNIEADRIFKEILIKTVRQIGLNFIPDLMIRRMRSRWGSCAVNRKRITLNSALIFTPAICIDYVVLHELTHFRYPGHDKMFYRNLEIYMPDWKECKRKLEETLTGEL